MTQVSEFQPRNWLAEAVKVVAHAIAAVTSAAVIISFIRLFISMIPRVDTTSSGWNLISLALLSIVFFILIGRLRQVFILSAVALGIPMMGYLVGVQQIMPLDRGSGHLGFGLVVLSLLITLLLCFSYWHYNRRYHWSH